jgi:uncharacterized circularly permuted ATP-grasp superfamily protein
MLKDVTAYYHDLLSNKGLAEDSISVLSRGLKESSLIFGGRLLSPYLRPYFISEENFRMVSAVCEIVWSAIQKVKAVAIKDSVLLDTLGLSDEERELVSIDPGYGEVSPTARLDSFLTDSSYSFVELNGESPAGIAYADVAAEIFSSLPVMKEFERKYKIKHLYSRQLLLEVLLRAYAEFTNSKPYKKPQIAICDLKGLPTQTEFELFKDFFEQQGYKSIICSPDELEFTANRLHVGDFNIDIIYKRLLVNEYLPLIKQYPALLEAYKSHAVCLVNSFRSKLVHKKLIFAIITDDRYKSLFTAAEYETIQRHVPWTRHVHACVTNYSGERVDLLKFIVTHKDKLVLKPNDDYGGHGVYIGWNCEDSAWQSATEHALKNGNYLVQERVTTAREMFPAIDDHGSINYIEQLVDLDPLLFFGKVGSAFTRLSSTELANVSSGGGMVPTFIIEGT